MCYSSTEPYAGLFSEFVGQILLFHPLPIETVLRGSVKIREQEAGPLYSDPTVLCLLTQSGEKTYLPPLIRPRWSARSARTRMEH